jgi:hypothetical protein
MAKTLEDHRKACLEKILIPYPANAKNLFVRDIFNLERRVREM